MKRVFAILQLACLLAASAWAQSTYGTLLGSVKDPAGAVIPNATITALEVNTHISKTTKTSGLGSFEIPNLLPGTYDVAFEASGFQKQTERGVILEAGGLEGNVVR